MTWTRKLLRQRIGGPAYLGDMIASMATGGTTTTLIDTSLKQIDDFYNYGQLVVLTGPATGDYRTVADWVQSTSTFTADRTFTSTGPANTNEYEIHRTFSAMDKNNAINDAILDAKWRWPRVLFAETILMADNTYRYTLTNTTITNTITSPTSPTNGQPLTVGSTANFPPSGRLKIENEYINYSAVASPTTFTLAASGARGANGSTAAPHGAGVEIGICPGFDKYAGLDLLQYDAGLSGTGPPWAKLDDDYYDIVEDNGVLYLQLQAAPPRVGNYFRLTYRARPLTFTADTGTGGTLDPDVEPLAAYICARASAFLCQQASMRAAEESKQAHWNRMYERFRDEAETYKSADMAPKAPGRVKYPTWGDVDNRNRCDYVDLAIGRIRA
jgi:hypothetical protein